VQSLRARESGRNAVSYLIGCDSDDPKTIEAAYALSLRSPIAPIVITRQPSLGGIVNHLSAQIDADVYCSLCDDIECLDQDWDECIRVNWERFPIGVWWWGCPTDTTFAIVSKAWKEAAGYIFTDFFPFWFDDMWLWEQWKLTTARMPAVIEAKVKDCGPATHRMRDIKLWCDFFLHMRGHRIEEARRIAGLLGFTPAPNPEQQFLTENETVDVSAIEAKQGDRDPPTPEYLAALGRVQAMMRH